MRTDGERRRRKRRGPSRRGPRLHAQPCLGNDTEAALAAEQHPVRARPRARPGQAPGLPDSCRRHRSHGLDQVVDVGEAGGEVPGGARGNPAADGRALERLRVEPGGQLVCFQLLFEQWSGGAGTDASCARRGVDLDDAGHGPEVQVDNTGPLITDARLDATDDTRAAGIRDDGDVRIAAPVEDGRDVRLLRRPQHAVDDVIELAADAADDVAVGAADAVCGSVERRRGCDRGEVCGKPGRHAIARQLAEWCWLLRRLHRQSEVVAYEWRQLLELGGLGLVGLRASPAPDLVRRRRHGRLNTSDSLLRVVATASADACAGVTATTTSPASEPPSEPEAPSRPGTVRTVTAAATTVGSAAVESSSDPTASTSTTSPGRASAAAAAPSARRTGTATWPARPSAASSEGPSRRTSVSGSPRRTGAASMRPTTVLPACSAPAGTSVDGMRVKTMSAARMGEPPARSCAADHTSSDGGCFGASADSEANTATPASSAAMVRRCQSIVRRTVCSSSASSDVMAPPSGCRR